MIAAGLALQEFFAPVLHQLFAVFLRIGGLMLMVPGFGDRLIPTRVRLVVAFAFTVVVAPAVPPLAEVTPGLIFAELLIGVALGFVFRAMAAALTIAGMMAAQLTSLAQLFGTVEPSSSIGNILNYAGLALLMASGLHLLLADVLIRSYDVFPPGLALPGSDLARWIVARAAQAFALAFALAAPFALAALIYNVAMGVINRAMPQLMVAMVGAPAITWASTVLLLLSAPLILSVWKGAMLSVLGDPLGGVP